MVLTHKSKKVLWHFGKKHSKKTFKKTFKLVPKHVPKGKKGKNLLNNK
jgi:hypothetical protein